MFYIWMDNIFLALSILFSEGFGFFDKFVSIIFNEILKTASENKSVWNWNVSFIPI